MQSSRAIVISREIRATVSSHSDVRLVNRLTDSSEFDGGRRIEVERVTAFGAFSL